MEGVDAKSNKYNHVYVTMYVIECSREFREGEESKREKEWEGALLNQKKVHPQGTRTTETRNTRVK